MGLWISWIWFIIIYFFVHIKISYYLLNRPELLQKANDRYDNGGGKDKTTKYYIENKEVLKENTKSNYKNMSEKRKRIKNSLWKE